MWGEGVGVGGLQKTKSAPLQIIRTLSACVAARLISQNLPYVKRPISATSVMISLFIPLSEKDASDKNHNLRK